MRVDELMQNIYVRCRTQKEAEILFEALDKYGYVEDDDDDCHKLNAEETFAMYDDGVGIYCHIWDRPEIDPGVTFVSASGYVKPDNSVDFSAIDFGNEEPISGEEPFALNDLFS